MAVVDAGSTSGTMGNGSFPSLLSPMVVGSLTLANRSVMGAMHTRIETLDRPAERLHAFYRARTEGEIGLILTGGISPNRDGRLEDDAPVLDRSAERWIHEAIVSAAEGTRTKICMQILHAGRYAKHAECVGPSAIRARINKFEPRALGAAEVWETIDSFAEAAAIARELGYHGVEVMGSEGYLINQFTAPRTNHRTDEFGGDLEGRIRFPVEIVKAIRRRVGSEFLLIYRISAMDLVEGGMDGQETALLARAIVAAGADMLNTGVGWHESSIPTVAYVVPRAAWAFATKALKDVVDVPVIASNRINDPAVADRLIEDGVADFVSMARPLLADPDFMRKTRLGKTDLINTCIACNQACLDHIFVNQSASCLVNPVAGHEIEFPFAPAAPVKHVAVVGGGAAGMAFAIGASCRGHKVTLFEAADRLGGQLLMARAVPLKSEFNEMLRFFRNRIAECGVEVKLGVRADVAELHSGLFDEIVIATGVRMRELSIPGIRHTKVVSYRDVLLHGVPVGEKAVIIGAGGIGFDVAEFLLETPFSSPELGAFFEDYGLDPSLTHRGGLGGGPAPLKALRRITMLQRSPGRLGSRLATSTGWIRKQKLARYGVEMISGATYEKIDEAGLHILAGGAPRIIDADTIVVCAGQESERTVYEDLQKSTSNVPVHIIGGAHLAAELDAKRAIDQASRLAQLI